MNGPPENKCRRRLRGTTQQHFALHAMTKQYERLVILMPVYEDRLSASQLLKATASTLSVTPYVIVVEDGSVREPFEASAIAQMGLGGEVIYLARNLGHQRAIAIGLMYIAANLDADTVVVMDSDGEDRPESIRSLIDELQRGDLDAVVARRGKRSQSLKFRLLYPLYRFAFYLLTGRTIRFGNFVALSSRSVRRLASMQELWVHFASSLMVSRLRIGTVETDRGTRYAGKSQMNFVSLCLHGLRSMMVFAEDVLVRVGLVCICLVLLVLILLVAITVKKFTGAAIPGWFSVGSGILVSLLMQAGILTFVILMISGNMRTAAPMTRDQLDLLIDHIEKVPALAPRVATAIADQEIERHSSPTGVAHGDKAWSRTA
jgi:polyisoprenyl-phosphate glycosyltransferase